MDKINKNLVIFCHSISKNDDYFFLINEIIIPYKEQLLLRNDSFFIVRDFQDDFTTVSSDYISKVTNKLKVLWENGLTDDDKGKIWDYFQSLISLAELASK